MYLFENFKGEQTEHTNMMHTHSNTVYIFIHTGFLISILRIDFSWVECEEGRLTIVNVVLFTSSRGNRCSPISPGKISHLPTRSPKNIFCLTLLFKLSIFARKLLKTSEFIRKYIRIPIKIGFRV